MSDPLPSVSAPLPPASDPLLRTAQPRRVSRADHRQQTRAALLQSARQLFNEHGYDGVSAEAIARAAGVTERTLFRYFPTKASLVLDRFLVLVPQLLTSIANRPAEEPPYVAVREALTELGHDHPQMRVSDPGPDWRAIDLPPEERERWLAEFVQPLTDTLRTRYGIDGDDMRAEVWARASVAAFTTAMANLARLQSTTSDLVAIGPQIVEAFDALDGKP